MGIGDGRGGRAGRRIAIIPLAKLVRDNGSEEIRERISSACLGFPGGGESG